MSEDVRAKTSPHLEELRERFREDRERMRELINLAYAATHPAAWALRDVAGPLALELMDLAREALELAESAEGRAASWERTSRDYERLAANAGLL